jgi:hypothetical protein
MKDDEGFVFESSSFLASGLLIFVNEISVSNKGDIIEKDGKSLFLDANLA